MGDEGTENGWIVTRVAGWALIYQGTGHGYIRLHVVALPLGVVAGGVACSGDSRLMEYSRQEEIIRGEVVPFTSPTHLGDEVGLRRAYVLHSTVKLYCTNNKHD